MDYGFWVLGGAGFGRGDGMAPGLAWTAKLWWAKAGPSGRTQDRTGLSAARGFGRGR